MNYYFLEYKDEQSAIIDLSKKGLLSDSEDFNKPMDIHFLGEVVEYDLSDLENPVEISRSGFLVNIWGKGSYDFGLKSREPKSPYCIPAGYSSAKEESE